MGEYSLNSDVAECLSSEAGSFHVSQIMNTSGRVALWFLRQLGKGYSRLQGGLVLLAVIGLEKTIQPYHIVLFIILTLNF